MCKLTKLPRIGILGVLICAFNVFGTGTGGPLATQRLEQRDEIICLFCLAKYKVAYSTEMSRICHSFMFIFPDHHYEVWVQTATSERMNGQTFVDKRKLVYC